KKNIGVTSLHLLPEDIEPIVEGLDLFNTLAARPPSSSRDAIPKEDSRRDGITYRLRPMRHLRFQELFAENARTGNPECGMIPNSRWNAMTFECCKRSGRSAADCIVQVQVDPWLMDQTPE